MSREYVVSAGGVTLANQAVTLVFINPGTGQSLEMLRCWASQSANATSAQQRVQTNTQVTAFPTLTSTTPGKLKLSDPASVITGATNGAAGTAGTHARPPGAGTKTGLPKDASNLLKRHSWGPTPPETIGLEAPSSSRVGL